MDFPEGGAGKFTEDVASDHSIGVKWANLKSLESTSNSSAATYMSGYSHNVPLMPVLAGEASLFDRDAATRRVGVDGVIDRHDRMDQSGGGGRRMSRIL